MNVFDYIPLNFFNPLYSAGNNRQYADCFLILYRKYDSEISYKIDRTTIRDSFIAYIAENVAEDDIDDTIPNQANGIINKFIECGWIVEDIDELTYERQLQMTDAGIALAEFLQKLVQPQRDEYSLHIINIFNYLSNKEQWSSSPYSMCIKPIFSEARKLSSSLKMLSTNMKKIIEEMTNQKSLKELTENLIEYCDGSFIKEYSRLIKKQNIHVFKNRIIEGLREIDDDSELFELIVIDCCVSENIEDESAGREKVLDMIHSAISFFTEQYNQIINEIKNKINLYFDLAISRARFLINHDTDTQSNIEKAIQFMVDYLSDNKKEDIPEEMNSLFNVYTQEMIDLDSLRFPAVKRSIAPMKIEESEELNDDDVREYIKQQKSAVNNPFSKSKMKSYVEHFMGDKMIVQCNELPLNSKDDLLAALAAATYAEENGYFIEKSNEYIMTNGYIIHDFTIRRKAEGEIK